VATAGAFVNHVLDWNQNQLDSQNEEQTAHVGHKEGTLVA